MARRPRKPPEPLETAPRDWDAIEGVSPPRATAGAVGHDAARAAFANAWAQGRRHHAWLFKGPRGVGKASFAYEVARLALGEGGEHADLVRNQALVAAGAHPGLFELRRGYNEKTKKIRSAISIDDVRRLIEFFQLSSADGGWRVALIDPADDMQTAASNALLKLLEEPPRRALFILIAHAAGRLPATIRSRCRRLDFHLLPLEQAVEAMRGAAPDLPVEDAKALAALAEGSPGEAIRLHASGGLPLYRAILDFLDDPHDPKRQRPIMDAAAVKAEAAPGLEMLSRLLPLALARLARAPYRSDRLLPPEIEAAKRLCPDHRAARLWAEAFAETRDRLEAAARLNLDPGRSILDTALYLEQTSRRARAA